MELKVFYVLKLMYWYTCTCAVKEILQTERQIYESGASIVQCSIFNELLQFKLWKLSFSFLITDSKEKWNAIWAALEDRFLWGNGLASLQLTASEHYAHTHLV